MDRVHYRVESIDPGVTAAIHRPGGFAICNSGLVDLGDDVLVFDTGLTVESAGELHSIAHRTYGRSPGVVVNSHWHLDHSLGNGRFSGLPIWGTETTRDTLRDRRAELELDLTPTAIEKAIRELESLRPRIPAGPPMESFEVYLQIEKALEACVGRLRIEPPNRTFTTRLVFPGPRRAELRSYGSGHTAADAVLYLPEEKVLFTGDLVCLGVEPSMGSGDPLHWLTVLDELEKLKVDHLVPGHGPVGGLERLRETREYLEGVLEAARRRPGDGLPKALRPWEGSFALRENVNYTRKWIASHSAPPGPAPPGG